MTKYLKITSGKTVEVVAYDTLVIVTVRENSKENGYNYAYFSVGGIDTSQATWGGSVSVITVGKNSGECLKTAIETGMAYKGVRVI